MVILKTTTTLDLWEHNIKNSSLYSRINYDTLALPGISGERKSTMLEKLLMKWVTVDKSSFNNDKKYAKRLKIQWWKGQRWWWS